MDFDVKLTGWPVLVLIVVVLAWPAYALVQASMASGAVDYCYVDRSMASAFQEYHLRGHRAWRADRDIATFQRMDDAISTANEMKCPLEKK